MEKKEKKQIIEKFAKTKEDTGSSEVQIALLTDKINSLAEHLRLHKKDNSSRRGLLAMVSLRRRLLKYLSKENFEKYQSLTDELNLKRK